VSFSEFVIGDSFNVENVAGVNAVHVEAATEGLFHVSVIGFPNDDLKISPVEVDVEEGMAWIGNEEFSDIRESDIVRAAFDLLLLFDGDVLKVHPTSEGIFGRGKAVGFRPGDVEGTAHSPVGIEPGVDEGREEDANASEFDNELAEGL